MNDGILFRFYCFMSSLDDYSDHWPPILYWPVCIALIAFGLLVILVTTILVPKKHRPWPRGK